MSFDSTSVPGLLAALLTAAGFIFPIAALALWLRAKFIRTPRGRRSAATKRDRR